MSSESSIVEEVRARAAAIDARYGHDVRAYTEHLRDLEQQNRERVVEQVRVTRREDDDRSKPAA